ncbi:hypothetical protein GBAR_LOCUS11771, partial [Geodia barretti]
MLQLHYKKTYINSVLYMWVSSYSVRANTTQWASWLTTWCSPDTSQTETVPPRPAAPDRACSHVSGVPALSGKGYE